MQTTDGHGGRRTFLARQAVRGLLWLGKPVPADIFVASGSAEHPVAPSRIDEDLAIVINGEYGECLFGQGDLDRLSGIAA